MKYLPFYLVLLLTLSGCGNDELPNQLLWEDLPVGASPEYVLKAVDGSKRIDMPAGCAGEGHEDLVRKVGLLIANVEFNVVFEFKDNGLVGVCLYPNMHNFEIPNDGVFAEIKDGFMAKYGKPILEDSNALGIDGVAYQASWQLPPKALIKLWYTRSSLDEGNGSLGILYYLPEIENNI
ncbi:hypothetical protein ACE02U_09190 [Shewanella xiamenensis]|uniref:hypothetical protein n=1 Tax=Shewanella xiamenensis TaxID=332186 RepID=UPI0035BAC61D